MLHRILCMILFVNFLGEIKGISNVRNTGFAHFNLPEGFDDDKNFDKSGFIPEVDFSHFFQRVDFDRSLSGFFDSPDPNPEASKREERIGKNKHFCVNFN